MTFQLEVNNKEIEAKRGDTILETLHKNGIKIPTLCRLKDLTPTGACRLCVVEVEGQENLIPACSYPVEEWMKIKTHSPRVINARKTIVELLLANHPDDCLFCIRNLKCELQHLAEELHIRERKKSQKPAYLKLDQSSPGIVRDPSKCILCGRCVRVCDEQQNVATLDFVNRGGKTHVGISFNKDLNFSSCILCGQCIQACPTGALHEKTNMDEIQEVLHNPEVKVVVQYAPSVTVSLAEEFGLKAGKDVNGVMNAVLRRIGFDYIFDSSFAADLAILEESRELHERIEKRENLPMINACCPAWVKYAEQFEQELLPNLSSTKSPQQIMGALIKTYFADQYKIKNANLFSVAIMPCTAKKFEAQREEMTRKAISDVDLVLSTRELAKLIKLYGIDMNNIDSEMPDDPFGHRSSAGKILGAAGGLSEAVLRSFHYQETQKEIRNMTMGKLRGGEGFRKYTAKVGERNINVAVVSGLQYLPNVLEKVKKGDGEFHFIEVMACPSGCVNGGGQPLETREGGVKARAKALYEIDSKETIRVAHKNPFVNKLYEEYLGQPCSEFCRKLLHTGFVPRNVL